MRLLLSFLLLILTVVPASALLTYEGEQTLWQDTVWQGEILIDGILTVAPEVTLEIRPGSIVRFTRNDSNGDEIGEHELFIQGIFLARGTAEQPILFTSAEKSPRAGDWGAVNMMASATENVLENCLVEYGYRGFHAHFAAAKLVDSTFRFNRRGAQFQESTVSIDNCRFEDNFNGLQFRDSTVSIVNTRVTGGYWGMRCVYSTLTMSDSLVANNLVNGVHFRDSEVEFSNNRILQNRRGLYLQRSKGMISGNVISSNSEHGIFLEDSEGAIQQNTISRNGRSGLRVINSAMQMEENNIIDNDGYAVINDGDQSVRITGNWWGTTDEQLLAAMIRDGEDRQDVGRVELVTPLKTPAIQ